MNMHRDSNVVVVTHIPSPYQVQLFNALVSHGLDKLVVYYVRRGDKTRQWRWPEIAHEFHIIEELTTEEDLAFAAVDNADLVVFSHYQHPTILRLIRTRQKLGRPWCFWGERPGFRNFGILGRLYRKWKLKTLHYAPVPIWGIGKWAVTGYQREFGNARAYFNVPYHSDLSRFKPLRARRCAGPRRRRFLYSGSLIKRKGVDLLANAFLRLADEFPHVELDIVGDGKLRRLLETTLARHGSRIRFHGFQQWDSLPDFYRDADVLCVPSRYDGWGLVVPEGLAAGLPVITTDRTGAAHDLIQPKKNGWLVKAGNAADLYQAMYTAATIPAEDMARLSRAARASVADHSLQHGVARFLQAVNGTLDDWQRRATLHTDVRRADV